MTAALYGMLAALAALITAAAGIAALSVALIRARDVAAGLTVRLAAASAGELAAVATATQARAELEDYRTRARAELANLRGDLLRLGDALPADPVARRVAWGRLLSTADDAIASLASPAVAQARSEPLPGVHGGGSGADAAPGGAGGAADRLP